MKRKITFYSILLFITISLSACDSFDPPLMCTDIGCSDQISILFPERLPEKLMIDSSLGSYDGCADQQSQNIHVLRTVDYNLISFDLGGSDIKDKPKGLSFTIKNRESCQDEESVIIYELDDYPLSYRKFQPNGKGCSPTCYSAKINMSEILVE
ncbi:MAG: hypothetical protein KJ709_06530 [Nanoarchaeota archaeon]|nr:hypothetical protein [Nanoarchaeota archaeon]